MKNKSLFLIAAIAVFFTSCGTPSQQSTLGDAVDTTSIVAADTATATTPVSADTLTQHVSDDTAKASK